MKSIALSPSLIIGFACTANAQTLTEKISGYWNQPSDGKKISWTFNADSTGSINISRRAGKGLCNVYITFHWEPAGDSSIRFSSNDAHTRCQIIGGDERPESDAKGMADGYVNKSEVYAVKVEEKGLVVGGWRLER
ncbi:hypothetical protein [Ferruginibacter sp. HRS2-29]|uniref:hypothetical protein n=1 Tax=Ferruginibacter sp. HRS2-29 TaxID=2487334 RepID=UPI0020CC478E|nr:hypothetical protein [Ferruginibacter sp. HRS2-29]MCP9751261.1 hypothetical protein [Ferruginibacter sp. HRS2-29]